MSAILFATTTLGGRKQLDSFPFAQSAPREYTPHLRPNEAGEACSRKPDLKVVRDLRLRCGGFGFGELRDDAELLHKAQSVPVDPEARLYGKDR